MTDIPVKILAKFVVWTEHVRHAIRTAFAPKIALDDHLAILDAAMDEAEAQREAEVAELDQRIKSYEADLAAHAEAYRQLSTKAESLSAANTNLSRNIGYFQEENAKLRARIANAEAALRP